VKATQLLDPYFKYLQIVLPQPHRLACTPQIRTTAKQAYLLLLFGGGTNWDIRQAVPAGSYNWKPLAIEFTSGDKAEKFPVVVVVESPTQAVWLDDIQLEARCTQVLAVPTYLQFPR
jgi:hypothetical protein